jgi:hypothetical protein
MNVLAVLDLKSTQMTQACVTILMSVVKVTPVLKHVLILRDLTNVHVCLDICLWIKIQQDVKPIQLRNF